MCARYTKFFLNKKIYLSKCSHYICNSKRGNSYLLIFKLLIYEYF